MDLNRVNSYMDRVRQSEQVTFPAPGGRYKVGVDLGTAYIVVVVLDEQDNPVACEKQAASVLQDGVVVDFTGAQRIVRELRQKLGARLDCELLNCSIAMPAGTESSIRTHQYVAEGAGFEVTSILDEPTAANAVYQIKNGVVVDIGGGSTDIAVISMGGRVKAASVPVAGNAFDRCIAQYVQEKFQIAIGPLTAEALKKQVACCTKSEFEGVMEVRGHSWETNLPARHVIYTRDLYEPVQELASRIAAAARAVLESTPPELAADVSSSGVLLTGGGSLLRGLASYIAGELHVDVAIAPDPLNCVARGTAISLSEGCYLTAGFRDATPKAWHKRLQNNHDPFAGE